MRETYLCYFSGPRKTTQSNKVRPRKTHERLPLFFGL